MPEGLSHHEQLEPIRRFQDVEPIRRTTMVMTGRAEIKEFVETPTPGYPCDVPPHKF